MSLEGHISIAFLALKGDVWFEQKPVLEEHVQKNMLNPIPKIKIPWFLRFVKTKQVVKKCKN